MSKDQYPQVGSDESRVGRPQSSERGEWPKRLRALTADELDRLTIDRDGRMYWDGKAVNYPENPEPMATESAAEIKPPEVKAPEVKPEEKTEHETIDVLDRGAADLAIEKPDEEMAPSSEEVPQTELPQPEIKPLAEAAAPTEMAETLPQAAMTPPVPIQASADFAPLAEPRVVDVGRSAEFAGRLAANDRIRLKLSLMQSAAMVVITVALAAAAFGIAASGFVAANEWGCRVGWITSYCPPVRLHPGLSARIAD